VSSLSIREATAEDADLLYRWRNDPVARENSFRRETVDWEEHQRWLETKLGTRNTTRIWILTDGATAAGQIRYDKAGPGSADISFSIDAGFRGRRLGSEILRMTVERACRELAVERVRGLVKPSNVASIRAFECAGFQRADDVLVDGERALVFFWPLR
jgi:RimJ/RimL family protein N-acetyltransferase